MKGKSVHLLLVLFILFIFVPMYINLIFIYPLMLFVTYNYGKQQVNFRKRSVFLVLGYSLLIFMVELYRLDAIYDILGVPTPIFMLLHPLTVIIMFVVGKKVQAYRNLDESEKILYDPASNLVKGILFLILLIALAFIFIF